MTPRKPTSDLISVIVPIYNSGNLLTHCIESILNQTYKNFELIIIDDASTDQSFNICKNYANKDNRIILLSNTINEGPGSSRNKGLTIAKGKYVSFIDSDDYIHPQFLEITIKAIKEGNFDIAVVNNKNLEINTNTFIYKYISKVNCSRIEKKILFQKFFYDSKFVVVWGKLYKKNILENLSFLNQYYSEDWDFSMLSILNSTINVYIDEFLYFRHSPKCSLTLNPLERYYIDHINALVHIYQSISLEQKEYKEKILELLFNQIINIKYTLLNNDNEFNNLYFKIYKKYKKRYFTTTSISLKVKLRTLIVNTIILKSVYFFFKKLLYKQYK